MEAESSQVSECVSGCEQFLTTCATHHCFPWPLVLLCLPPLLTHLPPPFFFHEAVTSPIMLLLHPPALTLTSWLSSRIYREASTWTERFHICHLEVICGRGVASEPCKLPYQREEYTDAFSSQCCPSPASHLSFLCLIILISEKRGDATFCMDSLNTHIHKC